MKLSIYFVGAMLLLLDSGVTGKPWKPCNEISKPKNCKPKNGCILDSDTDTCVKFKCANVDIENLGNLENVKKCRPKNGCIIDDDICKDFECRLSFDDCKPKYGCILQEDGFGKDRCTDKPNCQEICANDIIDICCFEKCLCSSISNKKKCKNAANCDYNKDEKKCGILGTGTDKCNKSNDDQDKCVGKCTYDVETRVCSSIPKDACTSFSGDFDGCAAFKDESCLSDVCTEACSTNCGIFGKGQCKKSPVCKYRKNKCVAQKGK